MTDDALEPIEEREIEFQGDSVLAVLVESEEEGRAPSVYVPLRPICERLGVAWAAQLRRINRSDVLSKMTRSVTVTVTEAGGRRDMIALPLDFLNGWLFGINTSRVKEEIRDSLVRYQLECYRVLADAFQNNTADALGLPADAISPPVTNAELATIAHDAREARLLGFAIADFLGVRKDHDDAMRGLLTATRIDLHELGGILEDGDTLTETQRRELYRLVLEVAALLSQAGDTRNTFAIAFGGFKKRFNLGKKQKYRDLERSQYREAHEFLDHWKMTLQGQIRKEGEEPCIV